MTLMQEAIQLLIVHESPPEEEFCRQADEFKKRRACFQFVPTQSP
jgi:hypothetical protein